MNRKLVFNLLFVLSAVAAGIALSTKPWQLYGLERKAANAAVKDMRKAETQRAELSRKTARYESDLGKEELARDRGYRKADETPVDEQIPTGQ